MAKAVRLVASAMGAGVLILAPVYLAVLLLLKAMQSLEALVGPLARLLPEWVPGEKFLSLLLVLGVCLLIGLAVRTTMGLAVREQVEKGLFAKIPGYAPLRSLTQQLAGTGQDGAWKPALVEIEDALVPAFIIEELDDGRFTIFVPSVPTPFAGAVYILAPARVHPLDVPFAQAVQTVTKWGSGAKNLLGAMEHRAP